MSVAPEVGGADLLVPPTLSPDREAEFDYPTCSWTNANGEALEVIYLGVTEERHLVVLPSVAWHRKPASRKFTEALSKPTSVQLPCASVSNREEMMANSMKGWLGYVSDEVAAELETVGSVEDREALAYPFCLGEDSGYLPHVNALAELAMTHYGFVSAESAPEPLERGAVARLEAAPAASGELGLVRSGGDLGPSLGLDVRVQSLEDTMSEMATNLQQILDHISPPAQAAQLPGAEKVVIDPKPKRVTVPLTSPSPSRLSSPMKANPKRVPALKNAPKPSYPSLDPGVVAAATAAGVGEDALVEMERLMGANLAGAKRLKESAVEKNVDKKKVVESAQSVLSESEDEEAEQGDAGLGDSSTTLEASLQRLTDIVSILASDKTRKAKSSKIDQALDGISLGSGSESSASIGGKRAAAARRALRQALVDHPAEVSSLIEKLLMEDLTSQVRGPGMPEVSFSARAWVITSKQNRGVQNVRLLCLGHCWSVGRSGDGEDPPCSCESSTYAAAAGSNSYRQGLVGSLERAVAGAGATVCFSEWPCSSGGGGGRKSLLQNCSTAVWAEISLAHLRDTEDFVTKRRNLGKKTEDGDKEKADKIRPKAKAKTKPSESHTDA